MDIHNQGPGDSLGFSTLIILLFGPLFGEYVVIIGFGLLGTLLALSETTHPTIWKSLLFLFKGVILSSVFTSLLTAIIVKYVLPDNLGMTPYAVMGPVAFFIGWSSNNLSQVRDNVLKLFTSKKDKEKEQA